MIDLGALPADGTVALPAALTELARMGIVLRVTANTFQRCALEYVVRMALLAGHFEVHTS